MAKDTVARLDDDGELPGDIENYRTLSRNDLDRAMTWEQVLAEAGLSEAELTYLGSAYRVVDKGELVNRPFLIRAIAFKNGNMGPYTLAYCVLKDTNEQVIFTDGSKGIHAQLQRLVGERVGQGHPYPLEYFIIPNGLRVSDYGLNAEGRPALPDEKVVGTGHTYYLA